MKVKTNVRAGAKSADDAADTSTSTSNSKQKQNGKSTGGGSTVYYPPVSRCVGI